jgi:hypothetical protein
MKKNIIYFSLIFYFIFISCYTKDEVSIKSWENFEPFNAQYTTSKLINSDEFVATGAALGTVDIEEASGIAESQVNPNSLWTHNDSDNTNSIFLLNKSTGKIRAEYVLKGVQNIDWEDIEIGPGSENGANYIYLADIGDNLGSRSKSIIYRFTEPKFEASHEGKVIELDLETDILEYTYPEGSRDAETLLIDHKTRDLYIISKRDFPARVFIYPYPQNTTASTTLTKVGSLPLFMPVGGNVSPDGKEILVKTYQEIFYWQHDVNEPLWKTLSKEPLIAPYNPVEPQGEAICFDTNGGYYTLSEKANNVQPVLYFYRKN